VTARLAKVKRGRHRQHNQTNKLNEDIVNARVSEHQALASGKQVTADEAVGSLVDVRV